MWIITLWVPVFWDAPVLRPEELPVADCELLIVTSRHSGEVAGQCSRLGLGRERILFLKNHCRLEDMECLLHRSGGAAGQEAAGEAAASRQRVISTPALLTSGVLSEEELSGDYVRLAALELICRRLEAKVPGAAAGAGCIPGGLCPLHKRPAAGAQALSFDSFSGFAPEDGAGGRLSGRP